MSGKMMNNYKILMLIQVKYILFVALSHIES